MRKKDHSELKVDALDSIHSAAVVRGQVPRLMNCLQSSDMGCVGLQVVSPQSHCHFCTGQSYQRKDGWQSPLIQCCQEQGLTELPKEGDHWENWPFSLS